jgi:hypothetical protein
MMKNILGIFLSSLCALIGALVLYQGISDAHSEAMVIGGATSVSVGLVTISLTLRSWLARRRDYKSYRKGVN